MQRFSWTVLGLSLAIMVGGFIASMRAASSQVSQETVNATVEVRLARVEEMTKEQAKQMREGFDKVNGSQAYGMLGIFANLVATGGFELARRRKASAGE